MRAQRQGRKRLPPVLETGLVFLMRAALELVVAERRKHRDLPLGPRRRLFAVRFVFVGIVALVHEVAADENRRRVLLRDSLDERAPCDRVDDVLTRAEARVAVYQEHLRTPGARARQREARRL